MLLGCQMCEETLLRKCLREAFTPADPKSVKTLSSYQCLFTLLGYAQVIAGANLINLLGAYLGA